ncbi:MAG: hypothetical protein M1479_10110 [Actinobacteria bacterium]|nr:hypothetical protein [Actinomycetota bacterium]
MEINNIGLQKKERILRTFDYGILDRSATYDIIHNFDLIEYCYGKKVNYKNAEDATCMTISKLCDMVRNLAIPYDLNTHIEKDEDGFIYKKEWWTKSIIERPFKTVEEAKKLVKKDISKISKAISKQKFCKSAEYNVGLFHEKFEYPEDLNSEFERLQNKMGGTVMVAPEFFSGIGPITTRYNYDTFVYLYNDYPELIRELIKTHDEYCLFRINSFPGPVLTPVAHIAIAAGGSSGLIFSPEFLLSEIFPGIIKMIKKLKEYGYKVIFNFLGNSKEIIDEIVKSGVDGYTPIEEISGVTIEFIKEKYPKLVLGFEIDSINLLRNGSVMDIIKKTEEIIKLNEKYGGIFIGSSGAINKESKIENVLAMFDTVKKYKNPKFFNQNK